MSCKSHPKRIRDKHSDTIAGLNSSGLSVHFIPRFANRNAYLSRADKRFRY